MEIPVLDQLLWLKTCTQSQTLLGAISKCGFNTGHFLYALNSLWITKLKDAEEARVCKQKVARAVLRLAAQVSSPELMRFLLRKGGGIQQQRGGRRPCLVSEGFDSHLFLAVEVWFNIYVIYQRSWYTIYGNGMQWVCIFLAFRTVSKAGMFDFGEKDPRNRHAQHTFEGHIPGWARYFETYPYNPIICISHLQHYKLQLIYYTYRLTDITLQTL